MDVKRKAVSGILVTLLLMSFLTPLFNLQPVRAVESGPLESPWPMFHNDAGHTGRSISIGPQEPEVKWIFDDWISDRGKWEKGTISQAPAIGTDGTIYLGAREGLYAINPDGTLKWLNDLGWVIGTPAIDKNGVINVVSGGDVFAIKPDGSLKWKRNVGIFYPSTSPIIGDSGSLYLIAGYITSDNSYHLSLFEIQPDGTKVCLYDIEKHSPQSQSTSVAIDSNGIIYFGCDNTLYAINPDGTLNWQIDFAEGDMSTPTISPDGTIYVSAGKKFHSINPNGEIIWSSSLDAGTRLPAAIGPDGTIYTSAGRMSWPGLGHKYLYAFNPEGSLKWGRYLSQYPAAYSSAPIVDAEGNIYVLGGSNLRVYNSNGDEKWHFRVGYNARSLSLSQDGTLYVPGWSTDERHGFVGYGLYAFGTLIEDWAPTCSVKLRKEGVEVSEIDVGEFLDIYVGDSTDDTGIKQVRFSSDNSQDGIPTGEWTEWYGWNSFLEDWDATTKIKRWSFSTAGYKEVWAEVKDDIDQTDTSYANVFVHPGYAIIIAGEADWSQKYAIDHSANNAYRVLRNLGFDDNHIFYLNTGSQQIDGRNVVDHFTSLDNLRNSLDEIKNKIGDTPTPLILYLIGHGLPEVFDFYTESDALSSTELREMLEPFHENLMLVVIGSCYSGSFITLDGITDSISAPNRIIITAAHDDEKRRSLLGLGGWYHSSDRFWGNLNKGLNVKDAFNTNAWLGDQEHLWLDDNGDYTGSPPHNLGNDGEFASATTIGVAGSDDLELISWYSVWIHSAGEVRVYDSQNRVTGLVDGEIKEEIPNSVYDEEDEIVAIFSPDDYYRYEIEGTETGTYRLNIASIESGETTTFTVSEIPIQDNTIHQYSIDWNALSQSEDGVTLQIDSDGDGIFDQTITTDSELTHDEFMLQTATTIDFDPDTLNLKSKGKWVTVYIELPEGYDVNQIDVSSIMLNDMVPAIDKSTEIEDYDDDGIADLIVKFDRQILIEYLKGQGYGDGDMIELIVTGEATGTRFEGFDTIQVISKGKS